MYKRQVQELEIDRNSITEKLLDIISQVSSAQIPITKESTGNLENRIASLKKQQSRLLSLFLEDIIKKSQLRQVNLIFEKEIHQLETKLDLSLIHIYKNRENHSSSILNSNNPLCLG